MKRLFISLVVVVLAACAPPLATPAPTQAFERSLAAVGCNLVPELLYQGQPVYFGDCVSVPPTAEPTETPTAEPSATDTDVITSTPEPSETLETPTETPVITDTPTGVPGTPTATFAPLPTDTRQPTNTPAPTQTTGPTITPGASRTPFPGAPLCQDWGDLHDVTKFHTVWNSAVGCHYDHEHGTNPFTPQVAAKFPGFDLKALGGGLEVNHLSPSSPIENTWDGKHGGWKWDVALDSYLGCGGFEGAPTGVNAAVLGYHTFGNYAVELNGRIHSALGLWRQCKASAPTDYGYVYAVTYQDYGQRTVPYQGDIMPYPDNFSPAYDPPRGQYISFDCFGQKAPSSPPERGVCRESLSFVLARNANANSIWTSKPTGQGPRPQFNTVFQLLFRIRDTMQLLDWRDQTYPFTFAWLCSNDGGLTYAAKVGCRYNNTTSKVHEIAGEIPAAWDNQPFDSDPRGGRITANLFTDSLGNLIPEGVCFQGSVQCFTLKLVQAFTGKYGSQLIDGKLPQFSVEGQPERDVYFCGQNVCAETAPGAQASGWVGPGN